MTNNTQKNSENKGMACDLENIIKVKLSANLMELLAENYQNDIMTKKEKEKLERISVNITLLAKEVTNRMNFTQKL